METMPDSSEREDFLGGLTHHIVSEEHTAGKEHRMHAEKTEVLVSKR